MIYLKPIGGLCNRMRAIDSMISLCEKHNKNLTIIWLKSKDLNCNFDEIFLPINHDNIKVIVIQNQFIYNILTTFLIKKENIIKNQLWEKMYDSKRNRDKGLSLTETDQIFYSTIEKLMIGFFKTLRKSFLIESGYRHCKQDENSYSNFHPTERIFKNISKTVNQFDKTFGIHIRRTDHIPSIQVSTDDKIISLIEKLLQENPNYNFFLSTDCSLTKEKLITQFKNSIITNQNLTYNRDTRDSIQYAVLDLFCLSQTQKIYGSFFSSYSQVAAEIGKIENIIIK